MRLAYNEWGDRAGLCGYVQFLVMNIHKCRGYVQFNTKYIKHTHYLTEVLVTSIIALLWTNASTVA